MSSIDAIQCDKCGKIIKPSGMYFELKEVCFLPAPDNRDKEQCGEKIEGDFCKKCMLEEIKLRVGEVEKDE